MHLVQISDLKHPKNNRETPYSNWPQKGSERLTPLQVANRPRPQEILALVDALTAMFGRIGMAEICQSCWDGHLNREKGRGCCGYCPLVGHSACLAKPMGCALSMCWDVTQPKFPRTQNFLWWIRAQLREIGGKEQPYFTDCFSGAVYRESLMQLSQEEKRLLHVLRYAVEAWQE